MIFDFSFSSVELPLLLLLFTYLTIALKKTYDISTWFRAALAATFVNLTYLIICVLLIILLSFVILFIIIAIDSYNASMYKYYSLINKCDSLIDYVDPDVCVLIDKSSIDNNYDLLVKETKK